MVSYDGVWSIAGTTSSRVKEGVVVDNLHNILAPPGGKAVVVVVVGSLHNTLPRAPRGIANFGRSRSGRWCRHKILARRGVQCGGGRSRLGGQSVQHAHTREEESSTVYATVYVALPWGVFQVPSSVSKYTRLRSR